jgi:hypothetical protein
LSVRRVTNSWAACDPIWWGNPATEVRGGSWLAAMRVSSKDATAMSGFAKGRCYFMTKAVTAPTTLRNMSQYCGYE